MTKQLSRVWHSVFYTAWRKLGFTRLWAVRFFKVPNHKAHSFESVLGILLFSTIIIFSILLLPLLFSLTLAGNTYVLTRVLLCVVIIVFLGFLMLLWKKWNLYRLTAAILVCFYATVAFLGFASWGVNTPFALLLVAILIVLSGILLGSRSTLFAAGGFFVALCVLTVLIDHKVIITQPQNLDSSRYGDVIGYGVLFFILAVISWLYSRQMERSLAYALSAEEALRQEKQLLAAKLKERTRKLQEAQLTEMQQLYRFAELGQLSTALLHDLSNHLTVLTLDIEDIQRRQHSKALKRAKRSIFYLDRMVDQVRSQLRENNQITNFTVKTQVQTVAEQQRAKAVAHNVTIDLSDLNNKHYTVLGDPVRFRQILTIVISNAIDAYKAEPSTLKKRLVKIRLTKHAKKIQLKITDWGAGISNTDKKQLFKPFFSTKEAGMGIGLFIAHQILETHFKGTITLSNNQSDSTEFTVSIPESASKHVG